ncbi:MAG: secondary thiamine-phosphate synthase enzyme YjbQ [Alicyclobacillus sp.]|nr:secondary thiamine-phosphate synthase enzyme YjbQ [Alicyclobacillus sp.]
MKSVLNTLGVQTTSDTQMIRITETVHETVKQSGIQNGMALVMTLHTTTAITVNEGLQDLEDDIVEMVKRVVPSEVGYRHARFLHSDGQMAVNAPSHLRGALLGMEVMFPVQDGRLVTGSRQTIYFVELDGPQFRQYVVHVIGE